MDSSLRVKKIFLTKNYYSWGVHLNRAMETNFSHKEYTVEWGPRRNRLTHSMYFE